MFIGEQVGGKRQQGKKAENEVPHIYGKVRSAKKRWRLVLSSSVMPFISDVSGLFNKSVKFISGRTSS